MRWGFLLTALGLLVFTLVLRALLVEPLSVHWDEYNFLAKVHLATRGELTRSLQTFHGHLFSWLPGLTGNEVDQVIAARWVMFTLAVITAGALAHIGWRLLGGSAGLFAAGVFGSFWYVQHHGTSFRYDGIIVTLLLVAVALLLTSERRLWPAALAGVLGGVSMLVSIKSLLYFPALAVVVAAPFWTEADRRRVLTRAGVFAASGFVTTVTLFLWHKSTLMRVSTPAGDFAGRAFEKMINLGRPFPRLAALTGSLRWDTPMWVLLAIGFALVVAGILYERGRDRVRFVCVLALATPLLSLYLYRNAWPYFYVSVLAGACLLAGAVWRFAETRTQRRPLLAVVAVLLLTAPVARTAWLWYEHNHEDENAPHRDLVAAVHEIFPEPVAYLDRCGMVASFPKANWFMTTWGMNLYRLRGEDVMAKLLREKQPKLLINNTNFLDLKRRSPRGGRYALTSADFKTLKRNYVPHWGDLWVPGRELNVKPDKASKFSLLIEGPYTVESDVPVEIDGTEVEPSSVVELKRGSHKARALGEERVRFTLRYGDHLHKPERDPVRTRSLFRGFKAKLPKGKWLSMLESDDDEDDDEAEKADD